MIYLPLWMKIMLALVGLLAALITAVNRYRTMKAIGDAIAIGIAGGLAAATGLLILMMIFGSLRIRAVPFSF